MKGLLWDLLGLLAMFAFVAAAIVGGGLGSFYLLYRLLE